MCQFLWVEDFEGKIKDTVETVFSSLIDINAVPEHKEDVIDFLKEQSILLETTFVDAFDFITNKNELNKSDCIILDIDLKFSEDSEIDDRFLPIIEKYGSTQDINSKKNSILELKKQAGYQLYIELIMNLGFPKDRVIFCSNHGNEMSSIKSAFDTAKMELPTIYPKDSNNELKDWILKHKSNSYITLRRGIIEACAFLKKEENLDKIQFNEFLKEKKESDELKANIIDYLETLEKFLPLVEPENKSRYYKLFVRALSHEWEDNANPKNLKGDAQREKLNVAFGWIMKTVRNGMAHNSLTQDFDESTVAFLFIVAMRSMFKLNKNALEKYEELLCSLFSSCSEIDMKKKITEKSIPLIENYAKAKEMFLKLPKFEEKDNKDKLEFNDMIHRLLHNSKIDTNEINKNLFQIFWFAWIDVKDTKINEKAVEDTDISKNDILINTSMIEVNYTHKIQKEACYQILDRKLYESLLNQNSFLFHFSRHIYNYSFTIVPIP